MAVLDANEVAVLRRSLDKLDQQMESRINVCGWQKFLKE
jgi:hypothetical protein